MELLEALGVTMTTYQMADGSDIYGEYGWVTETEFFDGADEPTDLIKKTWVLQACEPYQHIPTGWVPLDDE